MKHIWSIIATKSIIDKGSNMLSLIDCVEKIIITPDPNKPQEKEKGSIKTAMTKFEIVSFITTKKKNKDIEGLIRTELYDPKGKVLGSFDKDIIIAKGFNKLRVSINVPQLPVTDSGVYFFKIKLKEKIGSATFKTVSELPLEIEILNQKMPKFL